MATKQYIDNQVALSNNETLPSQISNVLQGQINSIVLTNCGSGYTSSPVVGIGGGGGGGSMNIGWNATATTVPYHSNTYGRKQRNLAEYFERGTLTSGPLFFYQEPINRQMMWSFILWQESTTQYRDYRFFSASWKVEANQNTAKHSMTSLAFSTNESLVAFSKWYDDYRNRFGDDLIPILNDGPIGGYMIGANGRFMAEDPTAMLNSYSSSNTVMIDDMIFNQWLWIVKNSTGPVWYNCGKWVFSDKADAVHFKLTVFEDSDDSATS